jgi:hypothetical protein
VQLIERAVGDHAADARVELGRCDTARHREAEGSGHMAPAFSRVAEVTRQDITIENGRVTGYRIRLDISFKYDSGD